MILNIKNLGALKEAEIDLSKDLILLCGHNNTGKTYVAYAIYGFIDFLDFVGLPLDDIKIKPIKLEKDIITIDILDFILSNKNDLEDFMSVHAKDSIYNSLPFIKKNFEFIFNFLGKEELHNFIINTDYEINLKGQEYPIRITKNQDTTHINVEYSPSSHIQFENDDYIKYILTEVIIYTLITPNLNGLNTVFFTSERAAINIFSKELALNKNQFFDKILKAKGEDRNKLLNFAEENINRYVKPIADELLIAEDLLHLQNGKSEFEFLAIELEKSILEGKISVGQYGGLQYQPNFYNEKEENVVLEIYQTSSLVKSLASLVFYLRHLAKKNDCIIIDEPELNLHPDNQVLVARFLARLVNEGFKVVASTHSDYVIGELSNLLMLNNQFEDKEKLMERYNYNQNEILDKEKVGVYYFEKGKHNTVPIEITKRGIQIPSVDEAIADLNERSSAIFYTLLETNEEE